MLLNKEQLAMSLCELAKDDYELLNDMIIDYLDRLDDKDIDGLEKDYPSRFASYEEYIDALHDYLNGC